MAFAGMGRSPQASGDGSKTSAAQRLEAEANAKLASPAWRRVQDNRNWTDRNRIW